MAAVTIYTDFGAQEKNVSHFFHCFTSICHEVIGPDAMILVIWMLSFKPAFPLSSFTFIKRLFSSSLLSAIRVCYLHAAKSLQSCPTLCDAIDSSPPGSTVPGILQVRTLTWVAISFSNAWKWKVKSENEVAQLCPTLCDPMDCSLPGFSAMGFSRQEYWSVLPLPSPLSAYLRLLIFLLAMLIPAWASSSPAFLMMYSAYKLNKQGDSIQPCCTPFPTRTIPLFHVRF